MYSLLKIISIILQFLSRKLTLFFGWIIGTLFYYFIPLRKSIAMIKINIAFPNLDIKERKMLLLSCYRHYGIVLTDFFRLPKVIQQKEKSLINISEDTLELLNSNKGGIILSAHIGNWEYIGPILGMYNIKCSGVAKNQRNSNSDKFFNSLRTSKNVKIISSNAGSKAMIQVIKDGSYLGLISDQNAGRRGTEIEFFNSTVSVPKGAAAFHLKTNSPILVGFCILHNNNQYGLSFEKLNLEGIAEN